MSTRLRAGTTVMATTKEASKAKVTARANGRKNSPTRPPMNARGRNTATAARVDDRMAVATSRVPSTADWKRGLPRREWT